MATMAFWAVTLYRRDRLATSRCQQKCGSSFFSFAASHGPRRDPTMQSTEDVNSVSANLYGTKRSTCKFKLSVVELPGYPRRIIPAPAGEPGQSLRHDM